MFYWQRLWALVRDDRRVIPLLIVGTIPSCLSRDRPSSFLAEKAILESPLLAGLMLPVSGLLLIWSSRHRRAKSTIANSRGRKRWLIGAAQAAAILPGLSRSGSTISTALGLGLTRESAATFSFLLAVPALAGAGVLEVVKILKKGDFQPAVAPLDLTFGVVLSFVVGLAALWVLVRMLERGRFAIFGWYCIALGIGVTIWQVSLLLDSYALHQRVVGFSALFSKSRCIAPNRRCINRG